VFVGIVSDGLWQKFCAAFAQQELGANPDFKTNSQRVQSREQLLPQVRALFKTFSKADLVAKLERTGLPFAPIARPEDLFEDPHLLASGGLGDVTLPDGRKAQLPILPMEMDGVRPTQGGALPKIGEHTAALLAGLGFTPAQIEALQRDGVV